MKRSRPLLRAGAIGLCVIILGCDELKYATVWKDRSAIALADGYTDYRGEIGLTDDGVVVFSYAYRTGSQPLVELRQRIVKEHPCYTVIDESATRLRLRCSDLALRFNGAYEFDFLLDEARRRVFVLRMTQVPDSEDRYRELVGALDDAFRRYEPRTDSP